MAQQVSMVKVMIASPGDVPQERHLVKAVIDEWNAVHASDRGVVLHAVAWETHSSPRGEALPPTTMKRPLGQFRCDYLRTRTSCLTRQHAKTAPL
jgi:hypothetical protein